MTAINKVTSYFRRQIDEISQDTRLRIFGALMALLMVFAASEWIRHGVARVLVPGVEGVCWPTFPNCHDWRILSEHSVQWIFVIFALLSLANVILFLIPRYTKPAFWMLFGLNLLKICIIAIDFRFRLNQHLMAFWVTMVFLFLPRKEQSIKLLVVLLYFWSGLLKLNSEWLSGSTLYRTPWLVTPALLPWATTYVIILETILAWFLLLDKKWMAWAVLAQFALFHIVSFPVVGFFYPATMFTILCIFPLYWLNVFNNLPEQNALQQNNLLENKTTLSALLDWRKFLVCYGLLVVFSMVQMIPKLMPGDTAITGEGRLFALHMFDSYTKCEVQARLKRKDGRSRILNLMVEHPIRTHCDPITYLSRARYLCQKIGERDQLFSDIDLSIKTRRSNETKLRQVVFLTDFCKQDIKYSLFAHNNWIMPN